MVLVGGLQCSSRGGRVGPPAARNHSHDSHPHPQVPNLRTLLLSGDFFLGAVVSITLAKLVVRLRKLGQLDAATYHRVAAECMLCMASILALGESAGVAHRIDGDSAERIGLALEVGAGAWGLNLLVPGGGLLLLVRDGGGGA